MMRSSLRQMKTIAIGHLSANDSGDLDFKKNCNYLSPLSDMTLYNFFAEKKYHVVQHVKRS